MMRGLTFALAASNAAGFNLRRSGERSDASALVPESNASFLHVNDGQKTSMRAAARQMVHDMLRNKGLALHEIVHHVDDRMDVEEALKDLEGKLPTDVASLVHTTRNRHGSDPPDLSEDSLQKARGILNEMVVKSVEELDDVVIDCNEFERANRHTFDQVVTDLARLGSEIAMSDEAIATNLACVAKQDNEHKAAKATLESQESSYLRTKAANTAEMTLKKNDLAVFDFIMDITKCQGEDAASFVQQLSNVSAAPVKVCDTNNGLTIDFSDKKLQAKIDKIMTPGARQAIRQALELAYVGSAKPRNKKEARFLQRKKEDTTSVAEVTTTQIMTMTLEPIPVREEPRSGQWKKCSDGKPNCGLLHDTMSLQWGKFKDLVDELQAEMDENADEWEALKGNLNEQISVITEQKQACQSKFDEKTGEKNTLTEESNEKNVQHHELTMEYEAKMATCKARIEELLFTDICAVRKVRNEVMKSSTVSPPDKITDCDIKDWVPEECSVLCDDTCPHYVGDQKDPYSCGGWMQLNRAVIVQANEYGIPCPTLTRKTRCGQFKCPVNCQWSEWSGWSKCTKECEGGAQQMTRSIQIKPKNGGEECPASVETRACNTGSCDRDCTLEEWTEWSPCSMACNPGEMPGFQKRHRHVLVPIRGEGTCPEADHVDRLEEQACNEHPCHGDEICIAKQDLILAIDASGSLRESGFEIVRDFAANLTGKYMPMYYGEATVQMGVILFGNGARNADGTIANAIWTQGLTGDLELVKSKIEETTWQKGFTNMAQAFALADTMFQQGGRKDAQSAVLVLSDGKYSFAFETEQKVEALKAKNTMIYMAPVADVEGEWQHKLKSWASQPWETNYEYVPGLQAMKHNKEMFASTLVAKFCPDAISPMAESLKEKKLGYMLIHEGGFPSNACGMWYDMGYVDTLEDCKVNVETQKEMLSFSISNDGGRRGKHCYAEAIDVTTDTYNEMAENKADAPCANGRWLNNPFYDVYVIEPLS